MPHRLDDRILVYLNDKESSDTLGISQDLKEDHQCVIGALKSLECLDIDIVRLSQRSRIIIELTDEGRDVLEKGSHEARVFAAVPPGEGGILAEDLRKLLGSNISKIGTSKAIAQGWLKTVKCEGKVEVIRLTDEIKDEVQAQLRIGSEGKWEELDSASLADLKKRRLISRCEVKFFQVFKGSGFTLEITKHEADLTHEMLVTGSWREKQFKKYNFKSLGSPVNCGHLHPLNKMRSEVRSIFLEMGFSEMASNRWVESSFWNFDALFVPQNHPARDAQDTFFMEFPKSSTEIPAEFISRVGMAHRGQDYGTDGHGPHWKQEECHVNCLRTHTTAATTRLLHTLGTGDFHPVKMFTIGRVYRNETLDQTHLAEFHQIEGVIADYDLSLGNLLALLKEFFGRLGLNKLRFKPAYNPYTKPSLEVFAFHDELGTWMEVGNSGIFRPEVVLPSGLPANVRVLAWGLSLERPTMIRFGLSNIRQLAGHKIDLQMVYDNPLCLSRGKGKSLYEYM